VDDGGGGRGPRGENVTPPAFRASLAALADETRWNILVFLGERPASASALAKHFPISRQAINKHLTVLTEAGLVESTVAGRERVYAPIGARLSELGRHLTDVVRAWDRRLAALKTLAEAEEQ
jgi:DNA-binding transcriptional ArsR family regulator